MGAVLKDHLTDFVNDLNFRYRVTCDGVGKKVTARACMMIDGVLYARCPDCIRLHPAQECPDEDETSSRS